MTSSRARQIGRALAVLCRARLLQPHHPLRTARAMRTARLRGSLVVALDGAVRAGDGRTAVADELGTLTFGELDRRSNALARAWSARGHTDRDVVALLCRDHRWAFETLFAAAKLGCTVVPMNTGFSGPQLADVIRRENVAVLVHDAEFAEVVRAAEPEVPRFVAWPEEPSGATTTEGTLEQLIATTDHAPLPPPPTTGGMVLLTSGTTGAPKGTPRNVRSPLASTQLLDRIPLRPGEATFIGAPIFHATGFAHFALAIALGSTVVVRRRFDARAALLAAQQHRCTAMILVPTMLRRILDLDERELRGYDLSALRVLFCAGSALPTDLGNRAVAAFGDVLYNLYGSTEVAVATVANPADWRAAPGTVGRCPVGCRVRLYDQDGKPVDVPNTAGRVFVSNGLQFDGYTDGGTKETIDGMMSTGDMGMFDRAGRLFVVGRDDDMIVSGGENVFPGEVEDLLAGHADIAEAAVVGVPDEEFGERLRAYVVPARPGALTAQDVIAHVRANLARHKVPRDVVFGTELPRNATGKVLRAGSPSSTAMNEQRRDEAGVAGSLASVDRRRSQESDIGRRRRERRLASGRRSDTRWQEILAAASAVFRRVGYPQATLEDVAIEVDLSRGTLYYYVGTKEELLVALLQEPLEKVRIRLEEVAAQSLSGPDKLAATLREYVRTMDEHPELFIFLSENVHNVMSGPEADRIRDNADRYGRVLAKVIADGAKAGEFRSDIEPRFAVLGIVGMFNWIHRWYRPGGDRPLTELGEDFVALALSSLAPH